MKKAQTEKEKLFEEIKEDIKNLYREAWMEGFNSILLTVHVDPKIVMESQLEDWIKRES